MIKVLLRNILRLTLLVLFQVLVLNNIQLNGFIIPYFYVLFILLMPFETPKWVLLVAGFFLGLCVDLFEFTLGIHASATVFMAYLRPYVLEFFAPRDGYETSTYPRISYYGFVWFFKYTAILVVAHHLFLFFLQVFRFSDFLITFSRAGASAAFSILLILLSQYIIFRK